MERKELITILNHQMQLHGFEKKSSSWYLDEGRTIKVVNLQKSNFGALHYVNLSIYIKALGNESYPKEEKCHIRTRLDNTMVSAEKDYSYLFDLENLHISNSDYEEAMKECVEKNILPQLEMLKTKEGVMQIAKQNPALLNILPIKVKEYLGIPVGF